MCDIPLLASCPSFAELIRSDNFFVLCIISVSAVIAAVAIISGMTASVLRARAREQTKRELAAYVAEGTLDADKAVAMMNAGTLTHEAPERMFKKS